MARSVWSLSAAFWPAFGCRVITAGTPAGVDFLWAAKDGNENASAQNEIIVAIFLTVFAPVIQDRAWAAAGSAGGPWMFASSVLPSRKSESQELQRKRVPI